MLFFFNDTATTEIYTLSLHDALPISTDLDDGVAAEQPERAGDDEQRVGTGPGGAAEQERAQVLHGLDAHQPAPRQPGDRKSTRLNSSHANISYAVFCLKKKKKYQWNI